MYIYLIIQLSLGVRYVFRRFNRTVDARGASAHRLMLNAHDFANHCVFRMRIYMVPSRVRVCIHLLINVYHQNAFCCFYQHHVLKCTKN